MIKRLRLLVLCYAAGLALLLLWHLLGFVQNRMAYAAGDLTPAVLSPADFELEGFATDEAGRLISVSGDAQMLLRDTARRVESVTLHLRHSEDPVAQSVFWAAPGKAYSVRGMAWPQGDAAPQPIETENGARAWQTQSTFWLPAAGGQALRIDPCAVSGDVIEIERVAINEKRPFFAFFAFSAGEGLALCMVPGLAASGLSIVLGVLPKRARKAGDAA